MQRVDKRHRWGFRVVVDRLDSEGGASGEVATNSEAEGRPSRKLICNRVCKHDRPRIETEEPLERELQAPCFCPVLTSSWWDVSPVYKVLKRLSLIK